MVMSLWSAWKRSGPSERKWPPSFSRPARSRGESDAGSGGTIPMMGFTAMAMWCISRPKTLEASASCWECLASSRRVSSGSDQEARKSPLSRGVVVLHGALQAHRGAGCLVRPAQVRQRERLLENGRPAPARGVAHLRAVAIDGGAGAPRDVRDLRRQALGAEQALEGFPVHLESDEAPRGTVLPLRGERPVPVEGRLRSAHRPAQVDLVWAGLARLDQRVVRGEIVHVQHDEPGLDAGDVHGPDARGSDP